MHQSNLDRSTRSNNALMPILTLFTVTFFIYRDFGLRMMLGYGILCLILAIHLLRSLIADQPPVLDAPRMAFVVLSVAVFLNFLRPDSRHDADSVSYIIAMIICCAFVALCRSGEREGKLAMGLCFAGGIFIASFVLFFQFFPQLFWDGFYHYLSETAQLYLVKYVPKGYAITLGGCTYTNYILYLGISVGCAYIASRKFDWRSAVVAVLCTAFLVALLIVGRRGELLGALICLALLVLVLCNKRWRRILLIGGTIGAVAAFALIVALLPWLKQFQPLVRYVMTFEKLLSGQDITSGRVELYALAISAFLDAPLFGIGFDQFHTLIPQEFLAVHGQEVEDVHCIYLQFLTETGIVGAPFLTAPLLYGYYLVCSQFRRLKHCGSELRTARMLCISSFMIQSFLLILGIYDPNFQRVVFWCFYAISIVLMLSALQIEGYQPADPVSRLLEKFVSVCAPPFVLTWNWAAGLFSRLRKS